MKKSRIFVNLIVFPKLFVLFCNLNVVITNDTCDGDFYTPIRLRHFNLTESTENQPEPVPTEASESSEPLLLTPYVNDGRIEEAKLKSAVSEPFQAYESYSGFLTVDNTTNANLFMWFFRCTGNDTSNDSVIVWLESNNNYPGSSGAFHSAGPYEASGDSIRENMRTLLKYFHILYIDSPVGSGFSYAGTPDGYATSFLEAGIHVANAVQQFVQIFEVESRNGVYLNGDKYTSKIAVYAAVALHSERSFKSSVKGIMLGNGLLDPINMIGMSDLLYQLGFADLYTSNRLLVMEQEIKRLIRSGEQVLAYSKYSGMISEVKQLGFEHLNDYTRPQFEYDPSKGSLSRMLSRKRFRKALHVGDTSYNDLQASFCYLEHDILTSVSEVITGLIPLNKFLIYFGQFGVEVNVAKGHDFVRYLHWNGAMAFHQLNLEPLCVNGRMVGHVKSYANFTYFAMGNTGSYGCVDRQLVIATWLRFKESESNDWTKGWLSNCNFYTPAGSHERDETYFDVGSRSEYEKREIFFE